MEWSRHFHPATTLRALGPKPWKAAYVQPSRRPKDGRMAKIQIGCSTIISSGDHQAIAADLQELYLKSLRAIGIDSSLHDIRFVRRRLGKPDARRVGLGGNAGATA